MHLRLAGGVAPFDCIADALVVNHVLKRLHVGYHLLEAERRVLQDAVRGRTEFELLM